MSSKSKVSQKRSRRLLEKQQQQESLFFNQENSSNNRQSTMMTTITNSSLTAIAPAAPSSPSPITTTTTTGPDDGGKVLVVRTPHPHDVLSGRGGGINSHVGNIQFREWVKERRNQYTLAGSKQEKARVAQEVIQIVYSQNPPGRFLQKDRSNSSSKGGECWMELDKDKVMAKTAQALREGAPEIRAAHGKEKKSDKKEKNSSPKRKASSPKKKSASKQQQQQQHVPNIATGQKRKHSDTNNKRQPTATSLALAAAMQQQQPLSSFSTIAPRINNTFNPKTASVAISNEDELRAHVEEAQLHPYATKKVATLTMFGPGASFFPVDDEPVDGAKKKRARIDDGDGAVEYGGQMIHPTDVTPPLTSADAAKQMPVLNLDHICLPPPPGMAHRSHSLTLSDMHSDWGDAAEMFVNPFDDELGMGLSSLWSSSQHPLHQLHQSYLQQQQQQALGNHHHSHHAQLNEQQAHQWVSMANTESSSSSSSSSSNHHPPRPGVHHDESSDTSTAALSANDEDDLAGLKALGAATNETKDDNTVPPHLSAETFFQATAV